MLGNQSLPVARRDSQRRQIFLGPDVPKRHTDITQKTATPAPPDRGITKQLTESCFIESKKIPKFHCAYRGAGSERIFSSHFCEAVPRACLEAIITTENAIADERAEFLRDGALQLDRQVGNASARIEMVSGSDGTGWAGRNAAGATPTACRLGRVRWQLECGQNFGEKKPGPQFAVEQHRALSMPANPCFGGKISLQYWAGVSVKSLLPALELKKPVQCL